ncbi:MAG: twin-arginine translocase TatA/TatE family subunit [Desulfobacteraceae bacterium]|nr:twin-arginine translocase TatA/TatE family subunit [Desulfobacteraceae bacterium]
MFGLGMPEILLILALALIIIGPKKLPDLAKTLGKSLGEFKNAAQDFKNSINIESSIADMDPPAEKIQKNVKDANKELAKDKDNDETVADADFDTQDDSDISDNSPDDKPEDEPKDTLDKDSNKTSGKDEHKEDTSKK